MLFHTTDTHAKEALSGADLATFESNSLLADFIAGRAISAP